MSESETPSRADRDYVAVWQHHDYHGEPSEVEMDEDAADDVHLIFGDAVRLIISDGLDVLKSREAVWAIIYHLNRTIKIAVCPTDTDMRWSKHLWELIVPEESLPTLTENHTLIEICFEKARSRIFPDWMGVPKIDVDGGIKFSVRPDPVELPMDWHVKIRQALQARGGNQGRDVRRPRKQTESGYSPSEPMFTEDTFVFRSTGELAIYRELKRRQKEYRLYETIGILPLPGMRVSGHSFEPDILVTYRGRVIAIEIDGVYHKGKWTEDKTREALIRNAGIPVERIDAADCDSPEQVKAFVDMILNRIVGTQP
ncbi:hypothetical protein AB0B89_17270 [Sphaerisporangium sp. NPDC049002]|uniref:hypothetical protein n=1 Tax=unclassified Sphaerisporangium TaxID=2630420 RepID=UPI0033C68201